MQNNVVARLAITGDTLVSHGADSYLNVPLLNEDGQLDVSFIPAEVWGGGGGTGGPVSWGQILNKPTSFTPSTHTHLIADVSNLQSLLDSLASGASLLAHTSNTSNPHNVTKAQVGLGNVDNTSDNLKPISAAQQVALDSKLSVLSFTWSNLAGKPTIPAAQVQPDWNATSGLGQILNKPTGMGTQVNSDWNAASGVTQILNKPTIPAAQVQPNWAAVSGLGQILNKPTIPTSIDQLTDVDTSTVAPTSGQSLVWNASTGQWVPATISGGGGGGSSAWGGITGVLSAQTDLNTALANKAALVHTHAQADVTGLTTALAGKAPTVHSHVITDITGLNAALGGKLDTTQYSWTVLPGKPTTFAPSAHTHVVADTEGLQTMLDNKAASVHTHAAADITSGVMATARLGTGTANNTTYLRGDGTWAAGVGGSGVLASSITVTGVTAGSYTNGNVIPASTAFETIFRSMLQVVTNPTYTAPTLTLGSSIPLSIYLGATISPTLTPTWTKNDAGTPPIAYRLKKNYVTIYSGTTPVAYTDGPFLVTGSMLYTCEVDYPAGPIKNDSASNPYPTGQIQAGTKTSNTLTFSASAYSKAFWGSDTSSTVPNTSAQIMGLSGSNSASTNGTTFTINIPVGDVRVIFAYPASLRDVTSVLYAEVMNIDVKGAFDVPSLVTVNGVSYKVYTFIAAEPFSSSATYNVTI